ncbi:MAG: hypothetical protein ACRYGC_05430 [Janthinobacterium lividum]
MKRARALPGPARGEPPLDRPPEEDSPDAVCRAVYAETAAFYAALAPRLGPAARGYEILYGPPLRAPPILFIGTQPGGTRVSHHRPHGADLGGTWPEGCEYATAPWPMAAHMRAMFGAPLLSRCTGTNAVFLRAPDVATYRREVPAALRREAAAFCRARVERMVRAMRPARIVAIGFDSLAAFGPTEPVLASPSGRTLLRAGTVAGQAATATLHLTGAWMTAADRTAMTAGLLASL